MTEKAPEYGGPPDTVVGVDILASGMTVMVKVGERTFEFPIERLKKYVRVAFDGVEDEVGHLETRGDFPDHAWVRVES